MIVVIKYNLVEEDFGQFVWQINGQVDGIPFSYYMTERDAETDGEYDSSKVQSYLNNRHANILQTSREVWALQHDISVDKLNKIEHPNFIIEWNPVKEEVELTDKAGTVSLTTLESRIATLEATVDALGEKPSC